MESYGKILLIAMPLFTLLVILEKIYGYLKNEDTAPLMDSVSSLSSGLTNVTKDVLGLSITLISYRWMVTHIAVTEIKPGLLSYCIAFIVIDFHGYWLHRWSHKINFFWNKHAIHHSSEEFNLACALRQSVSVFINLFTFLLIPAAILGVSPKVISITLPIHLFAQFWYHTKHIGKMGILEKIIVTPSHHRVHHALNPEYMDKNHGQIFIIWDKLFGTFQEELPEVKPVYGISVPAQTWNPIKINFQHLFLMMKDAFYTQNWKDKLRIWFMPTGWRPDDTALRFPVKKITNVYSFEKYGQSNPRFLPEWSLFQLIVTSFFVMYFFANIRSIGTPGIFIYGLFIFISVYSYTEMMSKSPYSALYELFRFGFVAGVLRYYDGWFGINQSVGWVNAVILLYFILSLSISFYFSYIVFRGEEKSVV